MFVEKLKPLKSYKNPARIGPRVAPEANPRPIRAELLSVTLLTLGGGSIFRSILSATVSSLVIDLLDLCDLVDYG